MAQPKFKIGDKIKCVKKVVHFSHNEETIVIHIDHNYDGDRDVVTVDAAKYGHIRYYADYFVYAENFSDVVDDPAKLFPYLRREMNNA